MARLGPVDFEDRLTLVEHLDELRTRIIISIVAFAAAFALCFWQNSTLLDIANGPLPGNMEPITFGVAEPFTTTVTVALTTCAAPPSRAVNHDTTVTVVSTAHTIVSGLRM